MLAETLEQPAPAVDESVVLEVENLSKHFAKPGGLFRGPGRTVRAVDGISFSVRKGGTLGIVGESGCGKTTTGRMIVHLEEPTGGTIRLDGQDVTHLGKADFERYRRRVQMVFQDATSSLDGKMRVGDCISEPLDTRREGSRAERQARVIELLSLVGMPAEMASRYPHQLSGGQRQRVGIARALALSPEIIVADEPTSALDVSVRAQVVNLLRDLQDEFALSYIFISHDLSTVRYISHQVAVMYLGQIVESGPSEAIFKSPAHPYTRALLAAVPVPDPRLEAQREVLLLEGDLPSPANPPAGCRFNTRCPLATARCREEAPLLRQVESGHDVACHYAE